MMSAREAEAYHAAQIETFADTAADMVCAITMNYVEEAVGIAWAAAEGDLPVAISFTVETDGRLPDRQPLRSAIEMVDDATGAYPVYYMINCAHPTHFEHVLADAGGWTGASAVCEPTPPRKSHAELNESPRVDVGDPAELPNTTRR